MIYKHKIVAGLADLIAAFGGGGKDVVMKAVWWGIKGQIPDMLKSLDANEEAVETIEKKLYEALGIEPPISPAEIAKLPIPGADKIPMLPSTEGYAEHGAADNEDK